MLNGNGRRQRQRQLQKINRYGKTGNKKRATFFATLLQNELNSDVVCFTPREKKKLATDRFERRWYTRNIANELVLHQCYLSTYLLPCYPRQ